MQTPQPSETHTTPLEQQQPQTTGAAINLRPPRHHVDPRAKRWWIVQSIITDIPIVIVVLVLGLVFPAFQFWFFAAAVCAAMLGTLYVVFVPTWMYRVHRWEMTDIAVYTASGWFWQEWRVAPLSRVQTVDTKRGPLQRMFGLSTVTITTASAAGAIEIEGLDHLVAEEIVARLTEITHATPGDAT